MKLITLLPVLLLTACKPPCNSVPELVSQTSEGIKLYRVCIPGEGDIYFSSSGTEKEQCYSSGKQHHCEEIRVPNANPNQSE